MPAVLLPLVGVALGATAMFLLDPVQGRRRRALLRDRVVAGSNDVREFAEAAGRDTTHRTRGLVATMYGWFARGEVSDEGLARRVRAKLGRFVSHPRTIDVSASQGHVTLTGPVLAREHGGLIGAVRSVRGVKEVEDRLAVYQDPRGISALQGGEPARGELPQLMQRRWSPATRVASGGAGGALLVYSVLTRRGPLAGLALLSGAAMLVRAATNRPFAEMVRRRGTLPDDTARKQLSGPLAPDMSRTPVEDRSLWPEV
jgi:hypothetical protein